MANFIYTAKRSIVPGHVDGGVYSLQLRMQAVDENRERFAEVQQAMAGAQEVLYYGGRNVWSFQSRMFEAAMLPFVREFLQSTEGGETITFDPYGTAVKVVDQRQGRRTDDRYQVVRALRQGGSGGGADDYFVIAFAVREL